MALTRPISKTVGPRLKTRALRTKEMPRVPRSMALDRAPVCRFRWKARSRLCRWRKTFLAMRRMELWATLPNTVFLSSLKRAEQARDTPSGIAEETESLAHQLWDAGRFEQWGWVLWCCLVKMYHHFIPSWLWGSSTMGIHTYISLACDIVNICKRQTVLFTSSLVCSEEPRLIWSLCNYR